MTNDLIARAEAAIKEPNNWVGRALVRELLAALKAARAENERLREIADRAEPMFRRMSDG